MKQYINQILPIKFGTDLTNVATIEFLFKQDQKSWECEYPGASCSLSTTEANTINVEITKAVTAMFHAGAIKLDTRITMTGSDHNPETAIATLRMEGSLFTE